MRHAALLATIALLGAILPTALSVAPMGCEDSGDASSNIAGASTLVLPTRCAGELPSGDGGDTFAFTVVAGKPLHIVIDSPDGWVEFALAAPDGDGGWTLSFPGDWHNEYYDANPAPGTWYLGLGAAAGQPHYTLEVDQNATSYKGKIIAGEPHLPPQFSSPIRVTESLGPTANGIDGAWIQLPWSGTGNETARLLYSDVAASRADLKQFDSAGNLVETCPGVLTTGLGQIWCGIAPGAAWIFIQASNTVAMDYELVTYH